MMGRVPCLGQRERELLITCARLELDTALVDRTNALVREKLDWEQTLTFAEAHSVAGLLRYQLQQLGNWDLVPPDVRQRLLQITHRTAYRNRLYTAALAELLQLLARDGVPVMVLKGLALVELVYRNPGLRPLIDLNLLVPEDRVAQARRLLLRRGYHEDGAARSRFYRWSHSQIILVKPGEFTTHVVLQWDVVTWPKVHAIDLHRFRRDAQPVLLSGEEVLIPSPVDFVLYLCLQADKYAFLNRVAVGAADLDGFILDERTHNRLIRFTDLYETARLYRDVIGGMMLADRARAAGIDESAYTSLRCVERLFGPVTSRSSLEGLRVTERLGVRRLAYRLIFCPPVGRTLRSWLATRFGEWWLGLRTPSQRRWIRLLDLVEYIFPRPDVLRRRQEVTRGTATAYGYLMHVAGALVRCALHVPSWVSYWMKARLDRRLQPEPDRHPARNRLLTPEGVARP